MQAIVKLQFGLVGEEQTIGERLVVDLDGEDDVNGGTTGIGIGIVQLNPGAEVPDDGVVERVEVNRAHLVFRNDQVGCGIILKRGIDRCDTICLEDPAQVHIVIRTVGPLDDSPVRIAITKEVGVGKVGVLVTVEVRDLDHAIDIVVTQVEDR